jgi:hypothetical protein
MKRSVYSFIFALRMKGMNHISKKQIVFSQWSRKRYAIFASLGKVVKIARVSVDICNKALKKSITVSGLAKGAIGFEKELSNALDKLWPETGIPNGSTELFTVCMNYLQVKPLVQAQHEGDLTSRSQLNNKAHTLLTIKHGPCYLIKGRNTNEY